MALLLLNSNLSACEERELERHINSRQDLLLHRIHVRRGNSRNSSIKSGLGVASSQSNHEPCEEWRLESVMVSFFRGSCVMWVSASHADTLYACICEAEEEVGEEREL